MATPPDLIHLAQAGDADAARTLIEQNAPAVYRLALSIFDHPEQALLAAHEAGIAQLEQLDTYPGPQGHTAWLYRLTLQVCRRRLRAQRLLRRLPPAWQRRLDPHYDLPERHAARPIIRATVELDEALRIPLVLRYAHDLLPQQIAVVLHLSERRVQAQLASARRQVRAALPLPAPNRLPLGPQNGLTHAQAEHLLEDAADHHITDGDRERLKQHLKQCDHCAEAARRLEEFEIRLRSEFQARWQVDNLPPLRQTNATLQDRRRRRSLASMLSLGAALLLCLVVVALVTLLPTRLPAAPLPPLATLTPGVSPTAAPPHSRQPVDRQALLAGIYPGEIAYTAFAGLNDSLVTFQPGQGMVRQLSGSSIEYSAPVWSPLGDQIAFRSGPQGHANSQLWVANQDGWELRRLPEPDFSPWWQPDPDQPPDSFFPYYGPPQWSPSGGQLATAIWADTNVHFLVIFSVDSDTAPQILPVEGLDPQYVRWSPNGEALAYLDNSGFELRLWYPRLALEEAVNPRSLNFVGTWENVFGVAWSPDSKRLAVLGGLRELDVLQVDLLMISLGGEVLRTIPISTATLTHPLWRSSGLAWSPDGRYLALIPVFANTDLVHGRILLIPSEGKAPLAALVDMEWVVTSFSWSGDGRWLAFSARNELWAASIAAYEGGEAALVRLAGAGVDEVNWQPLP